MYQSDLDSNLKTAEDRGVARGEAKGIARVARNLKTLNMPINEIVEATGLSVADIERL
jgi:predicted transposase/invertase (TIGR01784 family)